MESHSSSRFNPNIYDQASEWFVEFRTGEPDIAMRRRFHAWLQQSPEHVRAYLELAAIWNEGATLDVQRVFDEHKLMAALADAGNIVPLAAGADALRGETSPAHAVAAESKRKRPARAMLAAAASGLFAVVAVVVWNQSFRGVHSTGVGEQHSITLVDGSTVELNAKSRIRVRFTQVGRNVELLEGQALFHVMKDKSRPFVVRSGTTQIRAVGTQFDVYRKKSGTVVTVVEGRVAVQSNGATAQMQDSVADDDPAEVVLTAGEQVLVTPGSAVRAPQPDIAAATAWTQRQIVFEQTALAEVAEEFNRYNPRKLLIEDARLREFRVSGVFASTDISALIRFLRTRPDIVVTESDDEVRIAGR